MPECGPGNCTESWFCNLDMVEYGNCEACPASSGACGDLGLVTVEGLADCESSCNTTNTTGEHGDNRREGGCDVGVLVPGEWVLGGGKRDMTAGGVAGG